MNSVTPKISIIVPVYNVEKYLNRCIDSILNQTLEDIELILVDDGSKDGSGQICDEYAVKDCRVRVFHIENGGPAKARNLGIIHAIGEYIGFVDSDDYIESSMYERLYSRAMINNSDVVMCGYNIVTEDSVIHKILNYNSEYSNQDIIKENLIYAYYTDKHDGLYSLCNKIFKRSLHLSGS